MYSRYLNDIRHACWMVTAHFDHMVGAIRYTTWVCTKDDKNLIGTAQTDDEALIQIWEQIYDK